MNHIYKGHSIHPTVWHVADRGGWKPHVFVIYSDGDQEIVKNFTIDRIFPTSEEAEQAGSAFAQKWIDDGKPNLTR
jgi:hypothetical protein